MEYLKLRRVLLPVTRSWERIKVGTLGDTIRDSTPAILKVIENIAWRYQKGEEKSSYWWREEDYEENHKHSSGSPRTIGSESSPWVNDLLSSILDKVEGSDNMLKGMNTDFSLLNNKLNSHADAIRTLKWH